MSLNKVFLLGNLGKDPEVRYTTSQTAVCRFPIATSDRRKDASGNWTDHTEWHNVVVFGKTAENCANYLKKGRQVFVEGRIQTNKWQDKEGKDRYTTEIIGNVVQFIGGGKGAGTGAPNGLNVEMESQAAGAGTGSAGASALPTAEAIASANEVSFDDDDIPF